MFSFIKDKLSRVYESITNKLAGLFRRGTVDETWLKDLERILLSADTGLKITRQLSSALRERMQRNELNTGEEAHAALRSELLKLLPETETTAAPRILLMVGINGSGKTTFLGKLAHKLVSEGKKVVLVAGDTFRAAATQQLAAWQERTGADLHVGGDNQDPASVIFDACVKFSTGGYDHLLIDTAGRLQTRVNLMNELSKMRRIIDQKIPNANVHTWLTIDSMLGQNSLQQARQFHEAANLTGLVLTKYDGTGKGGILFAISNELALPVQYLTFGEQLEQLRAFEKDSFVDELLGE